MYCDEERSYCCTCLHAICEHQSLTIQIVKSDFHKTLLSKPCPPLFTFCHQNSPSSCTTTPLARVASTGNVTLGWCQLIHESCLRANICIAVAVFTLAHIYISIKKLVLYDHTLEIAAILIPSS